MSLRAIGSCWDEDVDEDLVCLAEAVVDLGSATLGSVLFEATHGYGANAWNRIGGCMVVLVTAGGMEEVVGTVVGAPCAL